MLSNNFKLLDCTMRDGGYLNNWSFDKKFAREYLLACVKTGVDVIEIGITCGSLLTKMFSAIYIGDWTSYYLALEYETDPTPVDLVEGFKKKL